ncbi:MAG: hypothetical protein K1X71_17835 [Pirellulales bacterium]|nr:hypothetical protein [Pirellulales bacterium]
MHAPAPTQEVLATLSRNKSVTLRSALLVVAFLVGLWTDRVYGQTETLSGATIGMDNQFVFAHTSLPEATGIDFSFSGGFAPMYPLEESHTVVINFEWGPTATGPWTVSPDYVNTVPGGMTDFFATGVFPGPDDAPFVAIHFYAGDFMVVSGTFTHTSVIPEPATWSQGMLGASMLGVLGFRRHRRVNSTSA